ncbi:MAG: Na+/H+ antiporter NhaA [Acidimicrobiia bacterium]
MTQRLSRAVREFVEVEFAGAAVLLVATAVALVWANSPWDASYRRLWSTELAVSLGSHRLALDLHEWVNDGLMALFFLVVGLEIKRELVAGELREPRKAALPAIAALGGMVVPAAIYTALNAGGAGGRGWGIPMATDIAFAVGVLTLLGPRVPPSLKVFLLTLAIVDDIGAIVVVAVFYSGGIHWDALGVAVGLVGAVVALRAAGLRATPVYIGIGIAMWLALHEAGVHATLAGVVMGLLAPAATPLDRPDPVELADVSTPLAARLTARLARESVSVAEWLEHVLHPWTSFLVVPVFALANAGVSLDAAGIRDALGSPVTAGVVAGLVVGKPLGITLFAWAAHRLGLGEPPTGATWRGLSGVATLAGIGFTVSLFVTSLAFENPALRDQARLGILAASLIAAVVGTAVLRRGAQLRGT